jgi:hypothetical protein
MRGRHVVVAVGLASALLVPATTSAAAGVPGAPLLTKTESSHQSVGLCWAPPTSDGGSAITSYRVTAENGADLIVSAATSCQYFRIPNAQPMAMTVRAQNGCGEGLPATTIATAFPTGYYMIGAGGALYGFGQLRSGHEITDWERGFAASSIGAAVDVEIDPTGTGYWIVHEFGRVFARTNSLRVRDDPWQMSYGITSHYGDLDPVVLRPAERVSSMSRTANGAGYWLFTTAGRVFAFGNARHFGDLANVRLNGPVLDSIATPSGNGYYMVASDGGVFAFGDAKFYGSMGAQRLNAPVMSLVPDADNVGYWLVARDGGIFAFDAPFLGSMGDSRLNSPVTGMVRNGRGYLMVGEDGGIFNFSDRPFVGSLGSNPPRLPIVAVAAPG